MQYRRLVIGERTASTLLDPGRVARGVVGVVSAVFWKGGVVMTRGRIVTVVLCLLFGAGGSAFGAYGLDGIRDSADFLNQLGPYPSYGNWSYEGGTVANPMEDGLGDNQFSFYPMRAGNTFVSDGDVMTMTILDYNSGSQGFYNVNRWGSHAYWPDVAANGMTVEWRMKFSSDNWSGGGTGFQFELVDGITEWYMNLKGDSVGAGTLLLQPTGETVAVDTDLWHNYRLVVLGTDPGDSQHKAHVYLDDELVFDFFTSGGWSPKQLSMVEWGYMTGAVSTDYIRIDTTGAYAPIPEPTTMLLLGGALLGMLRRRK